MTMPKERTLAVLETRAFLCRLAHDPRRIYLKDIRRQAAQLLRHYPFAWEMDLACKIEAQHPLVDPIFGCLERFDRPAKAKSEEE
jgi:hypothetical protein